MSVVDASVIVSFFMPQEVNHAISYRWLHSQLAANNTLVAPIVLLSEVGCAIARVTGQNSAAQAAVMMLRKLHIFNFVPVDTTLGTASADLGIKLRLRGTDAIYAAVAETMNLPLVSWDKEHLNRAGTILTVKTPT